MSKKPENPWTALVGHRVIVEPSDTSRADFHEREYQCIELSPSGERVHFRNNRGGTFWTLWDEYRLVEVIGPIQPTAKA